MEDGDQIDAFLTQVCFVSFHCSTRIKPFNRLEGVLGRNEVHDLFNLKYLSTHKDVLYSPPNREFCYSRTERTRQTTRSVTFDAPSLPMMVHRCEDRACITTICSEA